LFDWPYTLAATEWAAMDVVRASLFAAGAGSHLRNYLHERCLRLAVDLLDAALIRDPDLGQRAEFPQAPALAGTRVDDSSKDLLGIFLVEWALGHMLLQVDFKASIHDDYRLQCIT